MFYDQRQEDADYEFNAQFDDVSERYASLREDMRLEDLNEAAYIEECYLEALLAGEEVAPFSVWPREDVVVEDDPNDLPF